MSEDVTPVVPATPAVPATPVPAPVPGGAADLVGRTATPAAGGIGSGFAVTFRTMFKKVVTEQYPEERKVTKPRFHGRHVLNRHPDGLEKCVGCELCAWACPADAIYVEGADNNDGGRYSPGERYGRVYQINYLRCIFCGLCIEACPTRALTMSNEFELADDSRAALIYEKKDLLAPLLPGMVAPPHNMVPNTDEGDYYRGVVTTAVAEQGDVVKAGPGVATTVMDGVGSLHRSRASLKALAKIERAKTRDAKKGA